MRAIRAILAKELRQHAWPAVGLALVLGFIYAVLVLGTLLAPRELSIFEAHLAFLRLFAPVIALALGHRLVVVEYQGRTQLFVESLPIRRRSMVTVKLALGLSVMLAASLGSLSVCALIATQRESLDARFLAILASKTSVFAATLFAFVFLMGFTGRWRTPLYLIVGVGLFALDSATELDLARFGPFALVDVRLPFERRELPVRALLESLGLAASFGAVAYALALVNEGSIAESLAKRMSQREKALASLLVAAFVYLVTVLENQREKDPFAFEEDEVARSASGSVAVLYGAPERREAAEALAETLEDDLTELRRMLGWRSLPLLNIAYREDLDRRTVESVYLSGSEGVLLRTRFDAEAGEGGNEELRFTACARLVDAGSDDRAYFEPKAWVTDGFCRWWAARRAGATSRSLLRGLWVTRDGGVREDTLRRWFRTNDRLGWRLAEGLAHTGFAALEREAGRGAPVRLARAFLGRVPPKDLRALFFERAHRSDALVRSATEGSFDELLAAWNHALPGLREEHRDELARVPTLHAELTLDRGPSSLPRLVARVSAVGPRTQASVVSLAHLRLGAFDQVFSELELKRDERVWPGEARETLLSVEGRYAPGERIFAAVEVEDETLDCTVRLAARRSTVR